MRVVVSNCAIGANATYLVTDDRHILKLRKRKEPFPPVPIVTFAQVKGILKR